NFALRVLVSTDAFGILCRTCGRKRLLVFHINPERLQIENHLVRARLMLEYQAKPALSRFPLFRNTTLDALRNIVVHCPSTDRLRKEAGSDEFPYIRLRERQPAIADSRAFTNNGGVQRGPR